MRVAFVCQPFDLVLPPSQNSIGIWTYEVASRLHPGHDVKIVARRPFGRTSAAAVPGVGIELLTCAPARLWRQASAAWQRMRPTADPLFAQSFYQFEYIAQVARRIRRWAPELIHVQNFPHYARALRREAPDAAIVLHMHCNWLTELDGASMAQCVAASDLVVGCSEHVIAPARARFGEMGALFAVLPNGAPGAIVPAGPVQRTPGKVLFVGRISPEKGLHVLLEAWPTVVAARPEASLEIVGPAAATPKELLVHLSEDPAVRTLDRFYRTSDRWPGSYAVALRAMIPDALSDTIEFSGEVSYDRLIDRYRSASLVVNPSISESFGMSLIEALSVGTPVVVTRTGGMPEIIAATGGGLVVEKNDPAALAQAIITMLADPGTSRAMAERSSSRVAKLYSWPAIAALTSSLHADAVRARRDSAAQRCRGCL